MANDNGLGNPPSHQDGKSAYEKAYSSNPESKAAPFMPAAQATTRAHDGEDAAAHAGNASNAAQAASASQAYASTHADASPHAGAPAQAAPGTVPYPQGPTYAAPAQKQSHGWIVAIVVVLAIMGCIMFSVSTCSSAFSSAMKPLSYLDDSDSSAYATRDSVALIKLSGTIQYDGSTCSPEGLSYQLERAAKDDKIKGVVLRVDSGGGTATAGEEMAGLVRDFEKPIVVSSAATNASAAYEISSQADYIFTAKTTAIGSIGVALQVTNLAGLYKLLGIEVENITSADSKDASYGTRPLTEAEREWYQSMVDQINMDFMETVAEGRDMTLDQVRELANGLAYTGIDAVEVGLADEIGTQEDAVRYLSMVLCGSSQPLEVVDYSSSSSSLYELLDLLGSYENAGESIDSQALQELLASKPELRKSLGALN